MDVEFKKSFLANTAVNTIGSSQNLTTGQLSDSKSFEKTLDSKKQEMRTDRENSRTSDDRRTDGTKNKRTDNTDKRDVARDEAKRDAAKKAAEEKRNESKQKYENNVKESDVTKDEVPMERPGEMLSDEQNVDLMKQLAGILEVTPEEIASALDKLEMMPEDLLQKENMSKLIMEINNIADPAELLMIPDMANNIKEMSEVVGNAVENVRMAQLQSNGAMMQSQQMVGQKAEQPADNEILKSGIQAETSQTDAAQKAQKGILSGTQTVEEAVETNENTSRRRNIHTQENNQQQANTGGQQNQARNPLHDAAARTSAQAATTQTTNDANATPIITYNGEETKVEVNGKTVSRTTPRPQSQAGEILNQIVEKMKLDFKSDSTEIKIYLRPQDLGNLSVKIVTESGHVTAEIVAENSKVKELIEQNLSTLKDTLKQQGIDVGELSVSVGQQENDEAMQRFLREQGKSRGRMSQILNKINEEEGNIETVNYADEASIRGSSVDFSA